MTEVNSFKNYVFGTFIGHEASTLHNTIVILLGDAMRLALWQPILHQLLCIQLAPMHLGTGNGPAGTLDANGSIDHLKPRAGLHHLLDQAKVAGGQKLVRPYPDYEIFHSHFGRLVEFDQLLQLVTQRHWVFGPSLLGPEQLLR